MKRIGIYGGSFNPVHCGHIGIACRAAAEHSLERVLVVPAKTSPFKIGADADGTGFTDAQRWEMVVAACRPHPELEPCDIELRRGGVSYTIDTVRALKEAIPDASFFFIVGEDSLAGMPYWREWSTLKTLATFVAYPRTSESSTEIRRRLAAGEDISGMVPPAVAALIAAWRA